MNGYWGPTNEISLSRNSVGVAPSAPPVAAARASCTAWLSWARRPSRMPPAAVRATLVTSSWAFCSVNQSPTRLVASTATPTSETMTARYFRNRRERSQGHLALDRSPSRSRPATPSPPG